MAPVLMGSSGPCREFSKEAEECGYRWHHLPLVARREQMPLLRGPRKLLQGSVCSKYEPECDLHK
jgi:hypothetical protein